MASAAKLYTWEEIRRHNSDKSCWVVLYGNVCDMTDFLLKHPGGLDTINDLGGYDATKAYEARGHSKDAAAHWQQRIIGSLDKTSLEPKVMRKAVAERPPDRYSTLSPRAALFLLGVFVLFVLYFFLL